MGNPGKQIEIEYDKEAEYFFVLMRLNNGQTERLETAPDAETAQELAHSFELPGMPFIAKDICANCCRNLPWSLEGLPDESLCDLCSGERPAKKCRCGIPIPIDTRLCSECEQFEWEEGMDISASYLMD